MTATGWTGEPADEPAAGGISGFLLSMRAEPGPVDPLERARLAPDKPDVPFDADEHAANLLARRYAPGQLTDLALRLADTEAELAAERDKLEKGRRRAEHVRRAHQAGQIRAWDIPEALGDEGDAHRAAQLERRAGRLREQMAEAAQMISPPEQRQPDQVQAAVQRAARAHREFAEATRSAMAGTQARRPEPRPFAGRGVGARSEQCVHCIEQGVSDETSYLLHSDPELSVPVTSPGAQATQVPQAQADRQWAEADRLMGLGYSRETARWAAGLDGAGEAVR